MQLGRFKYDGKKLIGLFENGTVRDVSEEFSSFSDALTRPMDAKDADGESYPLDDISYLPPTTSQNSVFCVGLNYKGHTEESDTAVPNHPLVFIKPPRSLVGHREPIEYSHEVTQKLDYEGELAVIIGETARHVDSDGALDYVSGYTILNDITARDLQYSLMIGEETLPDWFAGKALQRSTPVGPYVAIDEIDDPQTLDITSEVNGEMLQNDNTQMMIQSVADLVSYISNIVALEPGDIIATGTPEGVGAFQDIRLHDGDEVEVGIEQIGRLTNTIERIDD